jgi:uncharacterized protein YodC (DUF2158 family)
MPTSRDKALQAKGQYGKVDIGAHFVYGQVIEVHSGGDYILFQRGAVGSFKPKWYHRKTLHLHAASSETSTTH